MTVSVSSQMMLFLLSIGIGSVFGLVYDVLYLGRLLSSCGKVLSFVWDCLYLLACGAFTFLFLLAGNAGEIRLFVLLGELLGYILYRLTVGVLVSKGMHWLAASMRRTTAAAGRQLKRPVVRAKQKWSVLLSKKRKHLKKSGRRERKDAQRCLKPAGKVMYNLFYKARHIMTKLVMHKKESFRGEGK